MENKFNKSIIYQITCNDPLITETYVGSTTDFKRRIRKHKSNCNNQNCREYNFKFYNFIRENGGFDNFTFNILEKYNCENKNELELRERYYIEKLKSNLNKQIPTRTKQEYNKQYKLENIYKLREYNNQKVICDICNSSVNKFNLPRHKKSLKCIKFQKLIENEN